MRKLNSLWPILIRLFFYGKPHYKMITLTIIILWLSSAAEVSGPMVIRYFIDCILPKKTIKLYIYIILIFIFIILNIISSILRYIQSILSNNIALKIIEKLRLDVMNSALKQPLSKFDLLPTGQLISVITNDTEVIKDLYINFITSVFKNIILIISMLIAMFLLDWRLTFISLFLFPVVLIVMWLYQYYSTPMIRKLRIYIADINNTFNEIINGMNIIQIFRQQNKFGNKIKHISYSYFKIKMMAIKLEGYLLRPFLNLLFTIILSCILLFFSFVSSGNIGIGILYAFINYLNRLNEPLIELTSQQSIIQQAIISGERIFELIDSDKQYYGNDERLLSTGNINIYNLFFRYRKNNYVLKNININILEKNFIAFVGKTGSGKSTIGNLIMGHYPVTKGAILLDGRSIDTLSYKVLRNGIYNVQQDPNIMDETIYDNITLGKKINIKNIWKILEEVKLANLIKKLPNGLFSNLGEHGNILSVGQKQLLSLSRVLILKPKILILDEVTANIDSGTEKFISYILNKIKKNTTLIVIAHRLSTIIEADKIFVLKNGKIIEEGNHKYLLNIKKSYYKMYKLQQYNKII